MPKQTKKDLNVATVEELEKIKQIGREHAQAIADYREENGDFESWEEVSQVPGISAGMVEAIQKSGYSLEVSEEGSGEEEEESGEEVA